MKVKDIETIVVTVPLNVPIRFSEGVVEGTTRTIIKLTSDEKIVGIGETVGAAPKNVIDTKLKRIVVGSNPFDIEKLLARCSGY